MSANHGRKWLIERSDCGLYFHMNRLHLNLTHLLPGFENVKKKYSLEIQVRLVGHNNQQISHLLTRSTHIQPSQHKPILIDWVAGLGQEFPLLD